MVVMLPADADAAACVGGDDAFCMSLLLFLVPKTRLFHGKLLVEFNNQKDIHREYKYRKTTQ